MSLDYSEAIILVHDALRQDVKGLPMGCFLLATRIIPETKPQANNEDSVLILLRVAGHSPLPNKIDTDNWRFDAARRSIDSPEHWDADDKTDQFTLNQLRHAGVRCNVLGTFRYLHKDGRWETSFGADISNFYSGQGMKVYKPLGEALSKIVNFTKAYGQKAFSCRKTCSCGSEFAIAQARSQLTKIMKTYQCILNQQTCWHAALHSFGMSRSGKSNTIKTISSAIFKLRDR